MKKLLSILIVFVLVAVNAPLVSAYSSVHVSSPHISTPHVSSPHVSAPRSTPRASTPRVSTPSTPRSSRVGTSTLRSSTPAPKPHVYSGKTYNSSSAPYTNTAGFWVFYWLVVTNSNGSKQTQCFDKNHKRITCNRDKNSYQKDW